MKRTKEYIDLLRSNCKHRRWSIIAVKNRSEKELLDRLRGTLEFLEVSEKFEELSANLSNSPAEEAVNFQLLAEQLEEDLIDYVLDSSKVEYSKAKIVFLPLPSADGFCVNRDYRKELLDGYIVCLHEGLWLIVQLLGKAFVVENFEGDLLQFRSSGASPFQTAIKHFLNPKSEHFNMLLFIDLPADVEGAAMGAQSAMATLILQYVVLHEFGHIFNRDLDLMQIYGVLLGSIGMASNKVEETIEIDSTQLSKYWNAEYLADRYALEAICRRSRNDLSRWANFLTVYVFFAWLKAAEKELGHAICPFHPSPHLRMAKLEGWMRENYPPSREAIGFVEATKGIIESWGRRDL